jgi:hypothetical protein
MANPELNLEGLSELQIEATKRLREYGKKGVPQNQFYAETTRVLGLDGQDFTALVVRKLIKSLAGNLYVHPDFFEPYSSLNPLHANAATDVARVLATSQRATSNPSGFLNENWEFVARGLPSDQVEIAEKLQRVPEFRKAVRSALELIKSGREK